MPNKKVILAKSEVETRSDDSSEARQSKPRRGCAFCANKKEPSYTDTQTLRRYISDRSKIIAKQRSGACSKHQRKITKEIKYARHLSLLPFVNAIH